MTCVRTARRLLLSALLLPGSAVLAALDGGESPPPRGPPNFLVIVADDLGAERISLYESAKQPDRTPNLETLGRDGLVFENVWSMPNCSATRAVLLTGEYPTRTGIGTVIEDEKGKKRRPEQVGLSTNAFTLPRALESAGYSSAIAGKWHLRANNQGQDHPREVGFDHHSGSLTNLYYDYFTWFKTVDGKTRLHDVYATTDTTDDALDFAHRLEEPWLIVVNYNAAHSPAHVPPAHLHSDEELKTGGGNQVREFRAMVEAMDTEIGRLLSGVAERDPFIVFLGDNGTPGWLPIEEKGSRRGKGTIREEGIHVPFIVKHSSIVSPGRRVGPITSIADIFATLVEISGAEIQPQQMPRDSVSFAPHLRSASAPPARNWMYSERFWPNGPAPHRSHLRAVRNQRYKLVRVSALEHQWFDLQVDPMGKTPKRIETNEMDAYLSLFEKLDKLPAVGRPNG